MMRIRDLQPSEITRLLHQEGLRLQIGPFLVSLRSPLEKIAESMIFFYGDYSIRDDDSFVDFHVQIKRPRGLRRWLRPQAIFYFDEFNPFKPLPEDQAFAMFEWGLNWCIATTSYQFLIIHAAVVAKNNRAIILPGEPGAGKSTLCAALVARGWRLLSDEMALINADDLSITPVPRPIGLKNDSIDIMQRFDRQVVIGPRVADTVKGTVAHMRPPSDSITHENCTARCIIFPTYSAGVETRTQEVSRAAALARIAEQSFNYHVLGADGFGTLKRLVSATSVYDLGYSQLDNVISNIDALIADSRR